MSPEFDELQPESRENENMAFCAQLTNNFLTTLVAVVAKLRQVFCFALNAAAITPMSEISPSLQMLL